MGCARMLMLVGCCLIPASSLLAQAGYSFSFGSGVPVGGVWGGVYAPYGMVGPVFPGPVILPPLIIPAETMYGPMAVQRFMGIPGIRTRIPPVIVTNGVDKQGGNRAANHAIEDAAGGHVAAQRKVRVSNAAARAQAARFMEFGDTNFSKQDYNAAYERYRTAATVAPDLPTPYLRQAVALVAIGRFERAAETMRRALLLEGKPDHLPMLLDELYVNNKVARTAHLEALALAVEASPESVDLLLLLGMYLFLDGQANRATPVFLRCSQLGGNEDGAISEFLPEPTKRAGIDKEI